MAFIEHQSEAHVLFVEAYQEDKEYFLKLRNLILNPAALANTEIVAQHKELISSGLSLANRDAPTPRSLRKDFFYAMFLYCVREQNIVIESKSSPQEEKDLKCLIETAAEFDVIRKEVSKKVESSLDRNFLRHVFLNCDGDPAKDLENCIFAAVGIDILGTGAQPNLEALKKRVDALAKSALIRFIVLKSCEKSASDQSVSHRYNPVKNEQFKFLAMKSQEYWFCWVGDFPHDVAGIEIFEKVQNLQKTLMGNVTVNFFEELGNPTRVFLRSSFPTYQQARNVVVGLNGNRNAPVDPVEMGPVLKAHELAEILHAAEAAAVQKSRTTVSLDELIEQSADQTFIDSDNGHWDTPDVDPDGPTFDNEIDLEMVFGNGDVSMWTDDQLSAVGAELKKLGRTLEECEKVLRELSVTDEIITKFIEVFNQAVPLLELDDILNEFVGIFGETNFKFGKPAHWILRHYPYGETPFDEKKTFSDYDLKGSLYRLWNPMECKPGKIPNGISARIGECFTHHD